MNRDIDVSIFKKGYKPLWENCPDSGSWFIRFNKNEDQAEIDLKWEKLIFALIGEQFEEPDMIGAVLSIRGRETIIELWFNLCKSETIKNKSAQNLRQLIQLEQNITLYFKENEKSFKDKSTLRNAESYNFVKNRKDSYNK